MLGLKIHTQLATSSINTYLPPTTKPELIFEIAMSAALLVLNIAYAFPTVKKDTPNCIKKKEKHSVHDKDEKLTLWRILY